jgi:hypothetical protein
MISRPDRADVQGEIATKTENNEARIQVSLNILLSILQEGGNVDVSKVGDLKRLSKRWTNNWRWN